MDNLTHTLTGLMLSRAGLHRLAPRASWILLLAANAPDVDVVAGFAGTESYLDHHRGWTHALALSPLLALVPALIVGLVKPRGFPWLHAWLVSLAGVVSHLLLDWTNMYGVRLAMPWTEAWHRLDTTAVVDPWIWAMLLGGVAWPMLARLVSSEIGARSHAGPGIARVVLVMLLLYEGGRGLLHARAVATLESRMYQGRLPRSIAALPHFANPFQWTGLLAFDNSWQVHRINLLTEFDPDAGRVYFQANHSEALAAAWNTQSFRAFRRFSQAPLWRVASLPDPQGAVEVTGNDLRFGLPGEGRFQVSAVIDVGGQVLESGFQFMPRGRLPAPR
jgi:inner membrane protein